MTEEKPQQEGQRWTVASFISPKIGEKPPVGAWIAQDPVCRKCMTVAEEIAMQRDFADPISAEEAEEKELVCIRCGKKIYTAS